MWHCHRTDPVVWSVGLSVSPAKTAEPIVYAVWTEDSDWPRECVKWGLNFSMVRGNFKGETGCPF